MFVPVERPKILEQSDPSPECSVTCQAVPANPWLLGPTGCKRALEPGASSQPLPRLGLPAWTLSFTVFSAVFSWFFNLLLQDAF